MSKVGNFNIDEKFVEKVGSGDFSEVYRVSEDSVAIFSKEREVIKCSHSNLQEQYDMQ